MITLALGKSIPTSIIVVETKIEYFYLEIYLIFLLFLHCQFFHEVVQLYLEKFH